MWSRPRHTWPLTGQTHGAEDGHGPSNRLEPPGRRRRSAGDRHAGHDRARGAALGPAATAERRRLLLPQCRLPRRLLLRAGRRRPRPDAQRLERSHLVDPDVRRRRGDRLPQSRFQRAHRPLLHRRLQPAARGLERHAVVVERAAARRRVRRRRLGRRRGRRRGRRGRAATSIASSSGPTRTCSTASPIRSACANTGGG